MDPEISAPRAPGALPHDGAHPRLRERRRDRQPGRRQRLRPGRPAGAAKVRGPLHLSTGQEAVPAGVCAHLTRADYLTSTHRGHGHTLAKGADLGRMMAELFGKADRLQRRQGRLDAHRRFLGRHARRQRRGGGRPADRGRRGARAEAARRRTHIIVCFFGDGAINRGPFLEALNWAAGLPAAGAVRLRGQPLSATTADQRPMTAGDGASARAAAHGHRRRTQVDGNDVLAVARGGDAWSPRCAPAADRACCTR